LKNSVLASAGEGPPKDELGWPEGSIVDATNDAIVVNALLWIVTTV
jgi:hypothetical protein